MKLTDLAFVNQQLAGMIRNGRPLEGALQQLCADMSKGRLKNELTALEQDLAAGSPLSKAIEKRDLPAFYRRMLQVGEASNDVPGMMLLLANYYNRLGIVWDKLKTATFYPLMVLVFTCGLAVALAKIIGDIHRGMLMVDTEFGPANAGWIQFLTWLPIPCVALMFVFVAMIVWIGPVRDRLKWTFPVSRNLMVAQFASSLALLLRRGCSLGEATKFMHELEGDSLLGREMGVWSKRIEEGVLGYSALGEETRFLPTLFIDMLEQQAMDLPKGLETAAALYTQKAEHQGLWLSLLIGPVGFTALGLLVVCQICPAVMYFIVWFESVMVI